MTGPFTRGKSVFSTNGFEDLGLDSQKKSSDVGQQDGSEGKCSCCQVSGPEFDPPGLTQ